MASVSAITRSSSTTKTLGLEGSPLTDVKVLGSLGNPGSFTQELYPLVAAAAPPYRRNDVVYDRCRLAPKSKLHRANPPINGRFSRQRTHLRRSFICAEQPCWCCWRCWRWLWPLPRTPPMPTLPYPPTVNRAA